MKGGYTNIDCAGIEILTETAQTVAGITAKVVSAHKANKPVYAYNITFDGSRVTPIAVMINEDGAGGYVCTASTLQFWVDNSDHVTIVNLAPSEG